MSNTHDVISAFLDDEPFDANELANALSDPEGRALLIDLLALRQVIQPGKDVLAMAAQRKTSRVRAMLAVAAVLVAMIGGYFMGVREQVASTDVAPEATRVVETGQWQPMP